MLVVSGATSAVSPETNIIYLAISIARWSLVFHEAVLTCWISVLYFALVSAMLAEMTRRSARLLTPDAYLVDSIRSVGRSSSSYMLMFEQPGLTVDQVPSQSGEGGPACAGVQ